jgi:hypothetical protein
MSEHLSTLQLRHLTARTLPAAELTALASHIASCDACKEQFRLTRRTRAVDASLSFTLAPEAWLRHEHLQYEQIASYIEGGLDAEEREIADLHLRGCVGCAEDVRSLREFRRRIAPEMSVSYGPAEKAEARKALRPAAGWLGWRWKPAYAAALALAFVTFALVAALIFKDQGAENQQANVSQPEGSRSVPESGGAPAVGQQQTSGGNGGTVANVASASNNSGAGSTPAVKPPRTAPTQVRSSRAARNGVANRPAVAATTAELNDGDNRITIDGTGNATGLSRLTPADEKIIRETLLAQNLSRPAELSELAGEQSALRGGPTAPQSFRLYAPARAVTADDRPTFRWAAMPGATSYRVYVGDPDNNEVANSGELSPSVTEWTPGAPLARGKVYTWAVIAKVNGKDVISPAPSQAEMRFKVLSADAHNELKSLQNNTRSHLALGVFYARAGMLDEAEREFRALVRLNPTSPLAAKLLRSVQSWR